MWVGGWWFETHFSVPLQAQALPLSFCYPATYYHSFFVKLDSAMEKEKKNALIFHSHFVYIFLV
jgi:hypothetical protein